MLRAVAFLFLFFIHFILFGQVDKNNFPEKITIQRGWAEQKETAAKAANQKSQVAKQLEIKKTKAVQGTDPVLSEHDQSMWQQAIDSTAPMTPAALTKFSEALYQRSLAGSEIPGGPYKVLNRMAKLNLAPGSEPEKISLVVGQGTVVSFVDRHGKPIIVDAVKSHSKAFAVYIPETETHTTVGASSFAIEAKTLSALGNISIILKTTGGSTAHLLILVESGRSKTIDGVVQLVHPTLLSHIKTVHAGDAMVQDALYDLAPMQGYLSGIAPDSAVELVMPAHASEVRVWIQNGKLYLRAPYSVLSPAWFKRQSSVDGMSVYELPYTPLIKLSMQGQDTELVLDLPYAKSQVGKP